MIAATRSRFHAVSVAGVALLLIVSAGCTRREHPAPVAPAAPPTVVSVTPVARSTSALPVSAPGLLARRDESVLSFKVDGVVEQVHVRAGDAVRAGQELARLRLDEIEARVSLARAALDKARRDEERVARLQAKAVSTLENLQDARTDVEVAEAQVRIAEFNRRFAVVTAPSDGRILRRFVEPDEIVAPGRPVLGFAGEDSGWLARVSLAPVDAGRLNLGDSASAGGVPGRITQISAAADPVTRTVEVEIALSRAPDGARSAAVVPVTLQPPPVPARPVVPASALIEGAGRAAHLFLVKPGATTATRFDVELEALHGSSAYLRTELPEGARVVVRGSEFLRDGATVSVQP
jgi:membrane fusion protein, multidrug efflux system